MALKAKHNESLWCQGSSSNTAQSSHKTHSKSASTKQLSSLQNTALRSSFIKEEQKDNYSYLAEAQFLMLLFLLIGLIFISSSDCSFIFFHEHFFNIQSNLIKQTQETFEKCRYHHIIAHKDYGNKIKEYQRNVMNKTEMKQNLIFNLLSYFFVSPS